MGLGDEMEEERYIPEIPSQVMAVNSLKELAGTYCSKSQRCIYRVPRRGPCRPLLSHVRGIGVELCYEALVVSVFTAAPSTGLVDI